VSELLRDFLEESIANDIFPSGVALVGSADRVETVAAAGAAADTIYDLASLTKVLATAALARIALPESASWERRIGEYLPDFKRTRFEEMRIWHLAAHVSGLPAWKPLYASGLGARQYRRTLAGLEPEAGPGQVVVYSDLGTLIFGEVLETVLSEPIDRAFGREIAGPAGAAARFGPIAEVAQVAPTELGNRYEASLCEKLGVAFGGFRTEMICGEVHDGNAYYRGGVAAHAGLFGTAEDVWRLARPWLDSAGAFGDDWTADLPESRGLFWQRKRGAGSAIEAFSESSLGHTGFTGTSLWIDRERGRIHVLLTNRVHPEVRPIDFNPVRQRFHEVAVGLDSAS
jgi:CubicO group peptidase (beta-lactamase class C family)